jgi:hypothetical protein
MGMTEREKGREVGIREDEDKINCYVFPWQERERNKIILVYIQHRLFPSCFSSLFYIVYMQHCLFPSCFSSLFYIHKNRITHFNVLVYPLGALELCTVVWCMLCLCEERDRGFAFRHLRSYVVTYYVLCIMYLQITKLLEKSVFRT